MHISQKQALAARTLVSTKNRIFIDLDITAADACVATGQM